MPEREADERLRDERAEERAGVDAAASGSTMCGAARERERGRDAGLHRRRDHPRVERRRDEQPRRGAHEREHERA